MKTKSNAIFIIISCLYMAVVSCGDKAKTGFNPEDRTTIRMTPEEKEAKLRKQRQTESLVDSMLYTSNVKMSVLPPAVSASLNQSQVEAIGIKMLQMLANNGIGGLNNVPGFALTAKITPVDTKATASVPQKFITDFDMNYAVVNMVNGDVYAATSQRIQGIGSSLEQATDNAINQIASDNNMSTFLSAASSKIINWFNENLSTLKRQVSAAETDNNYALALALVQSVPEQASAAFAYAESRRVDIENKFMRQIADREFVAMKQAISESDNEPSAEVYAHYTLIPSSASCYKEATSALNKYEKDIEAKRKGEIEQKRIDLAAERQYQLELAKMENSRIKAKYEAQASEQAIRLYLSQNSNRGFWSNLGARILGAIDGTNWQFRVKNLPYSDN